MRKIVWAFGFSALLVTGGIAVAVAVDHDHSQTPANAVRSPSRDAARLPSGGNDHFVKLRQPGDPCDGAARAATLAELSTTVPVWAPVGEEFTDAFICGGEPTLLYGGVEITYEDGWGHAAPDMLRRMVAQDGGRIQEINGRPVYVHPADETGPRNGVWILAGDYSVKLTAKPGIGIDRVVELARKIHIPASVG